MDRAKEAFGAALVGGQQLTREELGDVLRAAGIAPDGQRLPHLLMCAELDGLIISGPRRGKQFTYMLLEERIGPRPRLDREEAVARLVERYFRSRGPAQLQDFVWWSGLTMADARRGLDAAGGALAQQTLEERTYWFDAEATPTPVDGCAHLLPNFDEYTVGYRDRAAALDPEQPVDLALFSFGSILSNVVAFSGKVRGTWRRTLLRDRVEVEIRGLDKPSSDQRRAVEAATSHLGRFLGLEVVTSWTQQKKRTLPEPG